MPRAALLNLCASYAVTFIMVIAELCGVALAIELATSVHYLLWVPVVAFVVFLFMWRIPFQKMEKTYGVLGLAMLVFIVALWQMGPDWGSLLHQAATPEIPPASPSRPTGST